jgi:hypothetical protein
MVYLKWKGYQPTSPNLNLKQIKENFIPAQEYLDCFYPREQRNTIKELNINSKSLQGTLDLSDFVNLEELGCSYNKLTSLILPKDISNLKKLNLSENDFNQDLSFLQGVVNLEVLSLGSDKFYGSLKYLREMRKLRRLDISNTDIDSGLEYLSDSLREFNYSAYKRLDAKCQIIYDLFANEQGRVETDENGLIKNFPQKLKEYKQKLQQQSQQQTQILQNQQTLPPSSSK